MSCIYAVCKNQLVESKGVRYKPHCACITLKISLCLSLFTDFRFILQILLFWRQSPDTWVLMCDKLFPTLRDLLLQGLKGLAWFPKMKNKDQKWSKNQTVVCSEFYEWQRVTSQEMSISNSLSILSIQLPSYTIKQLMTLLCSKSRLIKFWPKHPF